MIKIFCDLCGKEIGDANRQVDFDINAYGCSGISPKEYNCHVECAYLILRKIEAVIQRSGQAQMDGERRKENAAD